MKMHRLVPVCFCLFSSTIFAQAQSAYQYTVDLHQIENDRVKVRLVVPKQTEAFATLYFPATIPGTYATLDYGRFISHFHATDESGAELPFEWGGNVFRISNAERLTAISYEVDDSFDAKLTIHPIFEPAGTNIEAGKNFLINAGGFFGCFAGQESTPFEITVLHPEGFYGVTSMEKQEESPEKTVLKASDYHDLVDNPALFSKPDTTSFQVQNTRIEIGAYCTCGTAVAEEIKSSIKELMEATGSFFGTLPVDHYTFIVYLQDFTYNFRKIKGPFKQFRLLGRFSDFGKFNFGALEHGHSSLYHLPYIKEITEPMLQPFGNELTLQTSMNDAAIHEFLHILTPLSLHSEHIGNFNFSEPRMSMHLWLYEGSTEYHAGLVRFQGGLMTEHQYMQQIVRRKIASSISFPFIEMSFTEMSANVLQPPYSDQYDQVYDYGALLALMLDIEIIRITSGEKRLKTVLFDLMTKYGKDTSFEDEAFISEFVQAVDPGLQSFFDRFISGRERIDFSQLSNIGYLYHPEKEIRLPKSYLEDNDLTVQRVANGYKVMSTGKEEWVGLKKGDIILSGDINKSVLKRGDDYLAEGETATLHIIRGTEETTLDFPVQHKNVKARFYLEKMTGLEPEQELVRQAWLEKK